MNSRRNWLFIDPHYGHFGNPGPIGLRGSRIHGLALQRRAKARVVFFVSRETWLQKEPLTATAFYAPYLVDGIEYVRVVRNENDRPHAQRTAQSPQHTGAQSGVESIGRLIQDQDVRPSENRPRDSDPLTLAS
jgi:hypothetical protein